MQIGFEEGLPCRLGAAAFGFDGYEDGVDLSEHIGVVGLQDPSPVDLAIHVEDS